MSKHFNSMALQFQVGTAVHYVDAKAAQTQQQELEAQRSQQVEGWISMAFDAGQKKNQADTSRVYAVHGMFTAVDDPWRKPSGFNVRISNDKAVKIMPVEKYLQQIKVNHKGSLITAAEYLSKPEVDVFSAIQWVYYKAMLPDVTSADSAATVVSRIAGEVCVIIALKKHRVQEGSTETLHDQLAGVARSAAIPAKWLDQLLPIVQHDQGRIWRGCNPPSGGKLSVRIFALQLQKLKPACNALPSVAKVVEEFAGNSKWSIVAAKNHVCSQEPALWHLVKKVGLT
jgi:hypothetical protein